MNTPMDRKISIHTDTPGLAQGPQMASTPVLTARLSISVRNAQR